MPRSRQEALPPDWVFRVSHDNRLDFDCKAQTRQLPGKLCTPLVGDFRAASPSVRSSGEELDAVTDTGDESESARLTAPPPALSVRYLDTGNCSAKKARRPATMGRVPTLSSRSSGLAAGGSSTNSSVAARS